MIQAMLQACPLCLPIAFKLGLVHHNLLSHLQGRAQRCAQARSTGAKLTLACLHIP